MPACLLQAASGLTREDLILEPQRDLDAGAAERFRHMIARREAREPVSRILGEREFYGRVFQVTPDVLDPRPDTETLVDAALKRMPPGARILDLGTGTGAIILTLLAERPDATGTATDISPAALAVARMNAARLELADRVAFRQASWFEGVAGQFDLIVSNPPYIPAADIAGLSPGCPELRPPPGACGWNGRPRPLPRHCRRSAAPSGGGGPCAGRDRGRPGG